LQHIIFAASVITAAAVFALLEIQIEGGRGWASSLPTWKMKNRWTRIVLGSRELTGYHLYAHLFLLVIVHLPFALSLTPLTWSAERRIIAFLILFWILEDFLWFIFNREYGMSGFNRTDAWWHGPSWWWIAPREYWIFIPIGVGLYLWSWI
jgi:hypothetical protein